VSALVLPVSVFPSVALSLAARRGWAACSDG
jgi:hypothetical protein